MAWVTGVMGHRWHGSLGGMGHSVAWVTRWHGSPVAWVTGGMGHSVAWVTRWHGSLGGMGHRWHGSLGGMGHSVAWVTGGMGHSVAWVPVAARCIVHPVPLGDRQVQGAETYRLAGAATATEPTGYRISSV